MSLFQKSVEKKYLNDLGSTLIDKKYTDFQDFFGSPEIQENIRNSKEEQYQGEFLIDLFVNILGYTKNPTPNFNLITELKNITNSKKADGAILKETIKQGAAAPCHEAIAIIELKGTDTTDLDKIETQAFGYKNHHPKCKYVITSNFEKLRFYIQNAVDHVDFDLFNLTHEQFSLMWLCLTKDNLLNDLPLKIKESSVLQEENITKKLYADYSKFREAIYNNLVKNNPETDKLLLFKKTQKLLDRFLFIFFAEDRLLLPPNSISEIVKQWADLKEKYDEYFPLYSRFKKYFGYMNTGYNGKRYDIYAYNGGLFKPDEVLDNITIDDDILYEHTLRLSNYDFETDVDVNILGHIFEHSLGEIENIQATIAEQPATQEHSGSNLLPKGEHATPEPAPGRLQAITHGIGEHAPHVSKRKKDGIFYTPKYITKYIVENTVGKLCEEKRVELGIVDEEYAKGRKNRKKEIVRTLDKKLEEYRNWLLTLTILDPACGSGAFLNQALEFLINEHRKIDELRGQLLGGAIIFSDITTDILEKNIYGVDLNEESVEIAKLSLWLRTAQKGRKLNTLSNNIKCGNSLIDDPEVAKATRGYNPVFNWYKEFPNIFYKKKKKAWHVTTATHNSRYSQRMFDNHVKKGEAVWLSEKEEIIVTETISEIVEKDRLNIVAYNICGDHAHIIISCTEEELPKIVQKIKAMSARACNIAMGRTTPMAGQREHAPRRDSEADARTREPAPAHLAVNTEENGEQAPRGKTQFHLWAEKFDAREVTSNEQLDNTIAYIRNNRNKHKLPENKILQKIIAEMTCTRRHAFRTEYDGGFDVVIGNPPYVHLEKIKETSIALKNAGYETYHSQGDIYCVFVEKGINLLKLNGLISYIMPNKWLQAGYGKPLREYFLKYKMFELIDFGDIQIFEGATTYPCIFTAQKSAPQKEISVSVLKESSSFDFKTNVLETAEIFQTDSFSGETWVISSQNEQAFLEKLKTKFTKLSDFVGGQSYRGVLTGLTEAFLIDEQTKQEIVTKDPKATEIIKPFLQGRNLSKYNTIIPNSYLILFEKGNTNKKIKNDFEAENWLPINYPSVYEWLKPFEERAKKRGDKGDYWWELRACDYYQKFSKPKIMYQKFQVKPCFIYDEQGLYCNDSMWIIPTENKALLGVLNSKMGWWLITKYCTQIQNGCQLIWKYFGQIPVPELNSPELTALVEKMLSLTKNQQTLTSKFIKYLKSQFAIEKLSRKLENWQELDFSNFIKELNKAIKKTGGEKLSKSDEMEWMELFANKRAEAQTNKSEIEKTDREIDQMVYELYGLTEEEIKIVENS
ncbi:N-6 DNA Methylase [Tangfeifania diversioriginum]|uniref:site-specific DNA-methyltransferase (adenine-specific) n=1 Tax=Tangfeifania diversioriginum TaxID=1168035 RepID=A0A1M6ADP7_9BACT|nr:N-6 DNA methylase [Tangfeifania diversioriginum]SHI34585.1 N-6 DNA Methylase [Tangfeifania diversioriginum]